MSADLSRKKFEVLKVENPFEMLVKIDNFGNLYYT